MLYFQGDSYGRGVTSSQRSHPAIIPLRRVGGLRAERRSLNVSSPETFVLPRQLDHDRSTDGENPSKKALRALSASFRKELDGPLEGHAVDRVALAQAGVRLTVGDVGAEAAVLDDDLARRVRIGAELLERATRRARRGAVAAAPTTPWRRRR